MSAQRLSARSIRRIARATGLDVTRAWAHGGYVMAFTTRDHQHGWFDKKTGEHGFYPDNKDGYGGVCYSSCPKDGEPADEWTTT